MSTFTKIFVVLDMLLAVLLVALVVPFVVNTETYKAKYQDEVAQRVVAETNAAAREADITSQIQQANAQKSELRNRISQLQNELNDRESEIQELTATKVALENANQDVRGRLADLSSSLKVAEESKSMLQEEVKNRREEMIDLQTRVVELSDSIRERTAQVETLNRQVRLLKEENQALAQRNEELQQQAESGTRVASASGDGSGQVSMTQAEGFEPETVIRGRVKGTREIQDGEQFISLDVGSNDQVRKDMKFIVHRGSQFLGNAVVIEVDNTQSIARVTLQSGEITSGAQVQAGGRVQ